MGLAMLIPVASKTNLNEASTNRRARAARRTDYACPNFADPSLLLATKNAFHDSLDVTTKS